MIFDNNIDKKLADLRFEQGLERLREVIYEHLVVNKKFSPWNSGKIIRRPEEMAVDIECAYFNINYDSELWETLPVRIRQLKGNMYIVRCKMKDLGCLFSEDSTVDGLLSLGNQSHIFSLKGCPKKCKIINVGGDDLAPDSYKDLPRHCETVYWGVTRYRDMFGSFEEYRTAIRDWCIENIEGLEEIVICGYKYTKVNNWFRF